MKEKSLLFRVTMDILIIIVTLLVVLFAFWFVMGSAEPNDMHDMDGFVRGFSGTVGVSLIVFDIVLIRFRFGKK